MGVSVLHGKENRSVEDIHRSIDRKIKRYQIELPDYYEPPKEYWIVVDRPIPTMRTKKYPKMYRPEFRTEYVIMDKDSSYPIGSTIAVKYPRDYHDVLIYCMVGEDGIKVGDKVMFKDAQNIEVIKYRR